MGVGRLCYIWYIVENMYLPKNSRVIVYLHGLAGLPAGSLPGLRIGVIGLTC